MSRHVTYRGVTLDMDSLRRENEKVPAMGNMGVNARGDKIKGTLVTKTSDQIAREHHRVQTSIVRTGLKGPAPVSPAAIEAPKTESKPKAKETKVKEVELPSGDIIMKEDNEN